MHASDIALIILLIGGMLVPAAWTRNWWLFRVFAIFFICFGLVEWWAKASTGYSVSQHFWLYSEMHPTGAWAVLAGMLMAWLALLWHLSSKLFNKSK